MPGVIAPGARRFTSALYYPGDQAGTETVFGSASGRVYVVPFSVSRATTFDRIAQEITTSASGAVVRLGIYADTGNGYPGDLVLDAGTIDAASTGAKEITISQTLQSGLYWLAAVAQGGSPGLRGRTGTPLGLIGATLAITFSTQSFIADGVTDALPSPFPTAVNITQIALPKILLRAA